MEEKQTRHQSSLTVYFCGSENCPPRHAYGPAVRPHYLLHVILEGQGIYQYKGQTFSLSAGDAFLIPPAEVTYYQADETNPWNYAWVGFDGKMVPELLSRTVFSEAFIFRNEGPEIVPLLIRQMKQLCETFFQSPEDQLAASGNLLLLFSFMKKKEPEGTQEPTQLYLQKAKEYLENNYAYPIRISDVARYTGIDRTYLYRIFMEKEKLSPKQYLLRHRLRIAVEMLCTTGYSITEIALSCGFSDISSFSGCFRQQFHISPRDFRKTVHHEQNKQPYEEQKFIIWKMADMT